MMNALIWNIRSVNTMKPFESLVNTHRQQHYQFIGLMEPKQKMKTLKTYREKLGILQGFANVSNKIWAFVDDDHDVDVIIDMEQQLTLKLTNMDTYKSVMVTLVYAKCDATRRIEVWDYLYNLARDMSPPWLVGGDFIVIGMGRKNLVVFMYPLTKSKTLDIV